MRYGLIERDEDQNGELTGFPVQSSVLDEVTLLKRVVNQFECPRPVSCRFYTRGDSDIYRVTTKESCYYLKVYRPPHPPSQAEAEAEYVTDLAKAGVNVVKPIRRTDGYFATTVDAPEGVRPILLFNEAPAGVIDADCGLTCRELGTAVAGLHQATDALDTDYQIPVFDIDSMATGTLPYAEQYLSTSDFESLTDTVNLANLKLSGASRRKPDFGLCHADLVMSNLRYNVNTGVSFFDFAGAAYTWRLLDIVTASRSMARTLKLNDQDTLLEVKAGYSSERALPNNFGQLLPAIQIMGWLGWIGGNAATLPLRLGIESMEGNIFTNVIQRIREAADSLSQHL